MSSLISKAGNYQKLVRCFWSEAGSVGDFRSLMTVRLAQSKVGPLVCPSPRTVTANVGSLGGRVALRTHTTDISVLAEIVVSDTYLPLLREMDGIPQTIVDLGANTGLVTRWFLRQWPDARVVAVEPEAGNVTVLRENVAEFGARVFVFAGCVGGYERDVHLVSEAGEHGFRMAEPDESGQGEPIQVRILESILESAGVSGTVDLLKCDIEGAELELFKDCRSWIKRVQFMVVECHDGFTAPELVRLLRRNGADFELLDRELSPAWNNEVGILRQVAPGSIEA